MDSVVHGCKDCPMYSLEDMADSLTPYNKCQHPKHETITVQDIDVDKNDEPITPAWCPLEVESLTLIKV